MSQQFPPTPPPPPPQIIVQQVQGNLSPTVTIGDWFVFVLLQCIPVVNIIMLIVYACDSTKPSRANFAKLSIILMVISCIISFLVIILFFGGLAGIAALSNH